MPSEKEPEKNNQAKKEEHPGRDKPSPDSEPTVLHTPGGEMPDPDEHGPEKEDVLTDEDVKEAG